MDFLTNIHCFQHLLVSKPDIATYCKHCSKHKHSRKFMTDLSFKSMKNASINLKTFGIYLFIKRVRFLQSYCSFKKTGDQLMKSLTE